MPGPVQTVPRSELLALFRLFPDRTVLILLMALPTTGSMPLPRVMVTSGRGIGMLLTYI